METLSSRACQLFKDFRRKFIKEQIHRHRTKAKWNWPELHLYCGMCDLTTGLYIKSVCEVIIYIVILVINIVLLYYLMATGATMASMEISDVEEYLGVNFTDVKVKRLKMIYTVLISYMVFWITFKIVYITTMFFTIYAIYKKKPKIIKCVLYVNSINCIIDFFISLFATLVLQVMSRTMVITCVLFQAYNLIALSSKYKQLRGKSKLLINMRNVDVNTEVVDVSSLPDSQQVAGSEERISDNNKHCETCTCNDVGNQSGTVVSTTENVQNDTSSGLSQALTLESETGKALNIKDVETIFNQDLLVPGENAVIEVAQCVNETIARQIAARPMSLNLPFNSKEKIDMADIPTIYDQNQLHVSGSPVVEENREYPRQSLSCMGGT